jgi:[pyruvate, water dikinase]-phosphate phosphotransferase / [pyruvate, water dikinase] kinase
MTRASRPVTYFHLHLVSDATGETLSSVAKAACAQFDGVRALEHVYALVRSEKQMEDALDRIEQSPGVVMFTLMNPDLREVLEQRCSKMGVPCIPVLDTVLGMLEGYLGTGLSHKPGGQHEMNASYFSRIEALNFTMAHDDGQNIEDIHHSDVILLGVSRTSKTPTCIYLANRGIKAANIPVVPDVPPPERLAGLHGPLIVGLTVSPDRLVQIRRNRLLSLNEETHTDYVDLEAVREEIIWARRYFNRHGWPVIDVTRRSIEETAAAILNLFNQRAASP